MISKYYEIFEASELGSVLRSSKMYEWVTFRRKLLGHNKSIRALACCSQNHTMITIDQTPSLILWDIAKGTSQKVVVLAEKVNIRMPYDAIQTEDGKTLWVSALDGLYMFDPTSLEHIKTLPYQEIFFMLPVDNTVWCGQDGKVVVLDATTGEQLAEIPDLGATISSMTRVGENSVWAAGFARRNNKGEVYILNTKTRTLERTLVSETRRVNCMVTASVCGHPYVWSGCDEGILVWDGLLQRRVKLLEVSGQTQTVQSLCVLPDQVWAGSKDRSIYIWTPDTHRCVGVLTGCHTDYVLRMTTFRHPGSQVYDVWTGSADRAICVWCASKIHEIV